MAETTVRLLSELAPGFVLAPERYDPRRALPWTGPLLGELVDLPGGSIKQTRGPAVILDTSDALQGHFRWRPVASAPVLGSSRRTLAVGDVAISRLRPYLRQLAWVDPALLSGEPSATIIGSPEFVAFRSKDGTSVAWLVPFLLHPAVQRSLRAAQEGSQHPRVPRAYFAEIPVPESVLQRAPKTAAAVEAAVATVRTGEQALRALLSEPVPGVPAERRRPLQKPGP